MDTKPAKLFKVGGYLLDPTGRLDANMIRSKIAYGCGYPFVTHYLNVQQEKVREISEDHPLMDEIARNIFTVVIWQQKAGW